MEGLSYGFWLLVAITAAYVFVSLDLVHRGNYPFGIVFAGYAFANIGMLWAMK